MNLISITAEIPEPLYRLATQTIKDCPHLSHDRLVAEAMVLRTVRRTIATYINKLRENNAN